MGIPERSRNRKWSKVFKSPLALGKISSIRTNKRVSKKKTTRMVDFSLSSMMLLQRKKRKMMLKRVRRNPKQTRKIRPKNRQLKIWLKAWRTTPSSVAQKVKSTLISMISSK